jgi:hydroxymethylbilane synthase
MELPSPSKPLRIGTRGSPLAVAQATETRDRLADAFELPKQAFEIVKINTRGDLIVDRPLKDLGGKGLFTKEIEHELLIGGIDIAVHSMKDMPTSQPNGLLIDTFLAQADFRDAFVSFQGSSIKDLKRDQKVGTSSIRRKAQLIFCRPDLRTVEFRGNVQTRIEKLKNGIANATFLAMAGLDRLGLSQVPAVAIEPEEMLPAIAQGVIGVERRVGDYLAAELLEAIHDRATGIRLACERAYLAELDGSCQTPIAGLAVITGNSILFRAQILRIDGSDSVFETEVANTEDAELLGKDMARRLRLLATDDFFVWN